MNKIIIQGVAMSLGLNCYSAELAVQPLKRGVNLSHWFSQTHLPKYPPVPATANDMKLIHSIGLDHVRLPVNPDRLWDFPAGKSFNKETLQQLDTAIQLAFDHHLNVVVDMHPDPDFKDQIKNDPEFFNAFVFFWEKLATHLAKYAPERLALEILNEPMVENPEKWQAMADELYAAIRRGAPKHTIIIGGGEWSDVDMLCQLIPVKDSNVAYTFHFYEPHVFTHQGAGWGEPAWKQLKGIPYPLGKEQGTNILAQISGEETREVFQDHIDQQWDAEKIKTRLAQAAAWAEKHQVSIGCGEFGVYKTYSDPIDRARYLLDLRTALEQNKIGWTLWDYQGSFSLIKETSDSPELDKSIGKALGLPITKGTH